MSEEELRELGEFTTETMNRQLELIKKIKGEPKEEEQ